MLFLFIYFNYRGTDHILFSPLLHTKLTTIICRDRNLLRFFISSPRDLPPSIQAHKQHYHLTYPKLPSIYLSNTRKLNSFLWILRHRGILRNEKEDLLAEDAAINILSFFYILHTYVLSDIQIETNIFWQKSYKQSINFKSIY